MGAFINNIQVFCGVNDKASFQEKLIELIDKVFEEQRLIRTEGEEWAARTIAIGPMGEEPWISIYDKDDNQVDLGELAAVISSRLQKEVVVADVYDSDILILRLFTNGMQTDSYNSSPQLCAEMASFENFDPENFDPENFGVEISEEELREAAGKPERWTKLIAEGYSSKDLRKVWDKEFTFAEDVLYDTSKILNFNENNCMLGYNYLMRTNTKGVTFLRYKVGKIS